MANNLWDFPDPEAIVTPLSIMREQAKFLSEGTEGRLKGVVETAGSNDKITIDLMIVVPRLNNYTYLLVKYNQPMPHMYPGYLYSAALKEGFPIANEKDFEKKLGAVLKSPITKQLLANPM